MMEKLAELVTPQQVGIWVIILLLVAYFAYKEWPEFKKRMTSGALRAQQMEETDTTLASRIENIESTLTEVNEKLDRDYRRLNEFERWQRQAKAINEESAEERALIMKGILACINGLRECGANGDTTEIQKEINEFLIRSSHKNKEV